VADDDGARIVFRVADAVAGPEPGSVIKACSRCLQPVWFCAAQVIPRHLAGLPLVCVPCGLVDDELRPGILRIWRDTYTAARWAERR
jgi:hypothetical protein